MAEVGETYLKKGRKFEEFVLKQVVQNVTFNYYYMLPKGLADERHNYLVFGGKVFNEEFTLIEEEKENEW